MGRYIAIGIVTDIRFQDEIDKEIVINAFPESIFDYSRWADSRTISIRDDYPGYVIAKLRKAVLGFIDNPGEKPSGFGSEDDLFREEQINQILIDSTMSEIRAISSKRSWVTFQKSREAGFVHLAGDHWGVWFNCFIISIMPQKFYPKRNHYTHEIVEKLEMLLHKLIPDNDLKEMVKCFITL